VPKSIAQNAADPIEVMVSAGAWTGKYVPVQLAEGELLPFLQNSPKSSRVPKGTLTLKPAKETWIYKSKPDSRVASL